MKIRSLRKQRTFRLQVELGPWSDYAWDVINTIEKDTIGVIDPHDEDAFCLDEDNSGAFLLDSNEKLKVPLADWLSLGCQRIRWEEIYENIIPPDAFAVYRHNLTDCIGVIDGESMPRGISVYIGEIVLSRNIAQELQESYNNDKLTEATSMLQFIIAHEFVHVFDYLKYLVPAFMNWRAFYACVMKYGLYTNELSGYLIAKTELIDSYGEEEELYCIKEWWPSRADDWFTSGQKDWSRMTKSTASNSADSHQPTSS